MVEIDEKLIYLILLMFVNLMVFIVAIMLHYGRLKETFKSIFRDFKWYHVTLFAVMLINPILEEKYLGILAFFSMLLLAIAVAMFTITIIRIRTLNKKEASQES